MLELCLNVGCNTGCSQALSLLFKVAECSTLTDLHLILCNHNTWGNSTVANALGGMLERNSTLKGLTISVDSTVAHTIANLLPRINHLGAQNSNEGLGTAQIVCQELEHMFDAKLATIRVWNALSLAANA